MENESGATFPVWDQDVNMPATGPLNENLSCDVCVVGAGLAGISTAYMLAKEGKSVIVLEAKNIGGGETSRTTAHLSNALDDRYYHLISLFGKEGARLACQSHTKAIDKIEELASKESIDCDFNRVDGYLFANDRQQEEQLLKELEATQAIGWHDVVLRKDCPVETLTALPTLHFPNQARFHPIKYLAGLAKAFLDDGGQIYTGSPVVEFKPGAVVTAVTASGHAVSANALVVATNTPVNDKVTIHTKQAPYRTYALGFSVPAGSVPDALYWDLDNPYHYIRLMKSEAKEGDVKGHDVLIVGGADHKTGQAANTGSHFRDLERWARLKLPMVQEVLYHWSGQVMEPVDSLAYIGRNPGDSDNVYIVTGDSGHGMTHATIAGMLLTDLIMERPNAWATIYDPARLKLKSAGEFLKTNLNVAAQMKDYVTPGEVDDLMQVAPGTGKLLRDGVNKIAVYCDLNGNRHQSSAICPHLGCVVSWNDAEKSWDCPCHGSRFDPYGKVINGPATKDLGPI